MPVDGFRPCHPDIRNLPWLVKPMSFLGFPLLAFYQGAGGQANYLRRRSFVNIQVLSRCRLDKFASEASDLSA